MIEWTGERRGGERYWPLASLEHVQRVISAGCLVDPPRLRCHVGGEIGVSQVLEQPREEAVASEQRERVQRERGRGSRKGKCTSDDHFARVLSHPPWQKKNNSHHVTWEDDDEHGRRWRMTCMTTTSMIGGRGRQA